MRDVLEPFALGPQNAAEPLGLLLPGTKRAAVQASPAFLDELNNIEVTEEELSLPDSSRPHELSRLHQGNEQSGSRLIFDRSAGG